MKYLDWIVQNKEWFFSGLGAAVLTLIVEWARRRRGHRSHAQHQRAGTNSQNIQAGRDVNISLNPSNMEPQRQPPTLRVLVHRAYFTSNPAEHFFIKIVNITAGVDVEVTHVWYQDKEQVNILTVPLPVRLRPNETFETYISTSRIPRDVDAFKHFHALISTGEKFASEHNKDVPPEGYVARP